MPLPPAPVRRNVRLALGCLLFAAGLFGTVHAARAAVAQRLYHGAKHGFFRDTPREVPPVVDYRDPGAGVEPARFAEADAEARYVRAEALAADGQVGEALDLWRPIVEREFWNGANHDEYARLLLLEGSRRSLELAVREKPLVEDPALRRRLERLGKSLEKRRK